MEKHQCAPENAGRFRDWIKNRGGVAIWRSVNLSNLGRSWSTPALTVEGEPTAKPSWESDSKPARIIRDESEIEVIVAKEVKRFHVALRPGDQGLSYKLTDASTRRVRTACEKAGEKSWYEFDYGNQEAVILVPDGVTRLDQYEQTL